MKASALSAMRDLISFFVDCVAGDLKHAGIVKESVGMDKLAASFCQVDSVTAVSLKIRPFNEKLLKQWAKSLPLFGIYCLKCYLL